MSIDLDQLFLNLSQLKVAVVGDVMLDTYWWGHVDRVSPEAPVPVVTLDKKELRIGGAGNVALNAASLGANVAVISVLGKDDDGAALERLLGENNIATKWLVKSEDRITTNKTRIISRNQQMMRLDSEMATDISAAEQLNLIEAFEAYVAASNPDVVILEDYNKGVLTEMVISRIIAVCNAQHIITAVDPKRKNFFAYNHATIFKPNLKEVKDALNLISVNTDPGSLQDIHQRLTEKLDHEISFITLSEKGVFYQQDNKAAVIPSHVRSIADVSGAGDTVIAVAAMVYAVTKDVELMSSIANIAGGLVCEEVGTVAIDKEKLLAECQQLLS